MSGGSFGNKSCKPQKSQSLETYMIYVKEQKKVPCQCGEEADFTVYGGKSCIWVGLDESLDGYKTLEAEDGYSVDCQNCGYSDGEPPTW